MEAFPDGELVPKDLLLQFSFRVQNQIRLGKGLGPPFLWKARHSDVDQKVRGALVPRMD